jgi:hypothetical protein
MVVSGTRSLRNVISHSKPLQTAKDKSLRSKLRGDFIQDRRHPPLITQIEASTLLSTTDRDQNRAPSPRLP